MTATAKAKPDTDALLYDRLVQELANAEKQPDRVAAVAEAALAGKSATATARDLHAEDTSRSLLTKGLERAIASVVQRIAEQVASERGAERAPHIRKLPDTAGELVAALHAQIDAAIASRQEGDERRAAITDFNRVVEKIGRAKLEHSRRVNERRGDTKTWGNPLETFNLADWLDDDELRIYQDGNPRFTGMR